MNRSLQSLKISIVALPNAAPGPSRGDLAKFFRGLKSGGERTFSIAEAVAEADKLLTDGFIEYAIPKYESVYGNAMFYALANGNVTFANYPRYNIAATFRDVPKYLHVHFENSKETLEQIADQDRDAQKLELLTEGANGDAEAAIEFCKGLKSGEISWGGVRG